MNIYIILYIILIIFSIITWKSKRSVVSFYYGFLSLLVFSLPGFRDVSVGTDTINYVKFFLNPNLGYDFREIDLGFQIWINFLRTIWKDNQFFIFCNAFISLFGILFFINKQSPYKILSLLLFVIVGDFYPLQFAAMRQTIAISLFLIALHFFSKGKEHWKSAFIIYGTAIFFHATVLWCLPVVLLMNFLKLNKKWMLAALAISFTIGLANIFDYRTLMGDFFKVVDSSSSIGRYGIYSNDIFGARLSSYRILWDMLPLSLVCTACIIYSDDVNSNFLKLFFAGVIANNLTISDPIAFRLVIYLIILIIVVLPLTFQNKKKIGVLICSITVIYFFYKSYSVLAAQKSPDFIGNKIVPYKTFF